MIKRNLGAVKWVLTLLQPSEFVRDELGGVESRNYSPALTINALQRDKSSTWKTVIGDYVTLDTQYFIIRDIRSAFDINTDWRLECNGYTYVINHITLLDDSAPFYLEIEATKMGGIS